MMFVYGIIGAVMGFVGILYLPAATIDRYVMLESLLLLVIIASKGFDYLMKRNKLGKVFVMFLALLMVAGISFGGSVAHPISTHLK